MQRIHSQCTQSWNLIQSGYWLWGAHAEQSTKEDALSHFSRFFFWNCCWWWDEAIGRKKTAKSQHEKCKFMCFQWGWLSKSNWMENGELFEFMWYGIGPVTRLVNWGNLRSQNKQRSTVWRGKFTAFWVTQCAFITRPVPMNGFYYFRWNNPEPLSPLLIGQFMKILYNRYVISFANQKVYFTLTLYVTRCSEQLKLHREPINGTFSVYTIQRLIEWLTKKFFKLLVGIRNVGLTFIVTRC